METYLPEEIIAIILCDENLFISDVINFSLTNKYYYDVIRNNKSLWKKKYFQMWPQLSKLFEKQDPDFGWYAELQYVYDVKRRTREILYTMSMRFYKHCQLFGPHFLEWMDLYAETPQTYYYLVYDLINIVKTRADINTIEVVPMSTPGNKTLKYYASKVLRYLLYLHVMEESPVRQPLRLPTLETAIVFAIQWGLPNLDVSWKDVIPNKFDKWAEKVKEHLKVIYPNHPLFAVPKEELKIWREEDIDGNKYDSENCKKVVQALQILLPFTNDFDAILPENDVLKEVTESDVVAAYGRDMGLLFTYTCVARRLGLEYEMTLSDYDTILGLRLSSNFSNIKEDMLQRAALPILKREQFDPRKAIYKYRFLRPSLCPGQQLLELLEALSPFNISSKTFMEEYYVDKSGYFSLPLHNVIKKEIKDPRSVIPEMIKIVREQTGCNMIVKDGQKVRPPNLKYAIGMVMQHVTTQCECLIYDWDPTCFASVEWQRQNNIDSLEFKNNQPFYNILNLFGKHEYIAQECLEPGTYNFFSHFVEDIGRYFSHELETHFVPNEAKEKEYPEDAAVRHMFHQKVMADNVNSKCKCNAIVQ